MSVAFIATGGSIAYAVDNSLELLDYPTSGRLLHGDELLATVPEVHGIADVYVVEFASIGSTAIVPQDWARLVTTIRQLVEVNPDLDGIVVSHGTATLEETAFFLDLTLSIRQPVVVVGAFRPVGGLSSDGPLNLVNAVRVASATEAQSHGVLVVLADRIHAARDVSKQANYRTDAFSSGELGPLGYVEPDGQVVMLRRPIRETAALDIGDAAVLPRVDVSYSYAGSDGSSIRAFIDEGASAIIVAGLPPGRPTLGEEESLRSACDAGVAVVQASRACSGRVVPSQWSRDRGFLTAYGLNPHKARILTMVSLGAGGTREQLQMHLASY